MNRLAVAVAFVALVITASPVRAAFHISVIDEIMMGVNGDPHAQYVEIRMLFVAQTSVAHSVLSFFACDGSAVSTQIDGLPGNISHGGNGVRWSMGTDAFAAATGVTPDFTFQPISNNGLITYVPCGMVCWGAPSMTLFPPADPDSWMHSDPNNYVDCVAYGGYSGTTKTSSGTPTNLMPGDGTMSLQRIGSTGNNSADFMLAAPTPTNDTLSAVTTTTVPGGATTTTLPGSGTGQPLTGTRLLLKTGAKPAKSALQLLAKDATIALADPRQEGGNLHVFTTAGDAFNATYPLLPSDWKAIGKPKAIKGYRFKGGSGPIKLILVKAGKLVKIVGKGAQLQQSLAADPQPVNVVLTTGAARYCMSFGGTPTFTAGKRFLATNAPAPAACP
jgi:hypothetical protein